MNLYLLLASRVGLVEIAPVHGQSIGPSLSQRSFTSFLCGAIPKEELAGGLRHQVGHDNYVIDRQRCLSPARHNRSATYLQDHINSTHATTRPNSQTPVVSGVNSVVARI